MKRTAWRWLGTGVHGQSNPGYAEVPDAVGIFAKVAKSARLAHTMLAPGAMLD
jgi:hypothetical protein